MSTTCRWDAEHGWLTREHQRDCDENACSGCKPCPKSHCGMRGRCAGHVEAAAGLITCPSCIGRVRADLRAVVELHAVALPEEAVEAGVDSEALSLVGPAAIPDAYDSRRGFCEFPKPKPDPHPYSVLGAWDLALRETYGPPTDLLITVRRAADYLTGLLAGPFPHGDEFEEFANSLAACRAHLEQVIHDSRTPEKGRPCPTCDEPAPKLRKRYASGTDAKTKAGENDTWHCPADPAHWWSENDYREKVATDYVDHASELPAKELAYRVKVPVSQIRKWAARSWDSDSGEWVEPALVSRKRSADGRKLYPVEDAQRLVQRSA